jgi:hypothetical protein
MSIFSAHHRNKSNDHGRNCTHLNFSDSQRNKFYGLSWQVYAVHQQRAPTHTKLHSGLAGRSFSVAAIMRGTLSRCSLAAWPYTAYAPASWSIIIQPGWWTRWQKSNIEYRCLSLSWSERTRFQAGHATHLYLLDIFILAGSARLCWLSASHGMEKCQVLHKIQLKSEWAKTNPNLAFSESKSRNASCVWKRSLAFIS